MKVFTGSGIGEVRAAVEAAARGLTDPSAIIFMASFDQIAEASRILREKFAKAQIIGTIGTKLHNGSIGDRNIVITAFFEDAVVQAGLIPDVTSCPMAKFAELERHAAGISPGRDNSVCIEFTTGNEEALVTSFQTVLKRRNVPLLGGSTFGNPAEKAAVVAYNGKVYEDACCYLLIKNTAGRILTFKENIYVKDSDIPHFATKVDAGAKGLIELDGRPAADVYSEELGISKHKIVESVFQHPMGRVVGENVFISSQYELRGNGELINYKRINRGDCIYFLKLGDYPSIEARTRDRIKADARQISLVFSVDCIYRYLFYQKEGYIGTYAGDMAGLGTHVGIVSGGEQYKNQHMNQTMICAVFE